MRLKLIKSAILSTAVAVGLGLASQQVWALDDPAAQALNYIQKNKQQFGLNGSDVGDLEVLSVIPAGDNGISHVYVQQRYKGIEVAYGIFTVNLTAEGKALNPGHRFQPQIASAVGGQNAKKNSRAAAETAAEYVGLKAKRSFEIIKNQGGPNEKVTLSDAGIAAAPSRQIAKASGAISAGETMLLPASTLSLWAIAGAEADALATGGSAAGGT